MSKQEILDQIEKIDKNLAGGKLDSEQAAFVEKNKAKLQAQLATLESEQGQTEAAPKEQAPKEAKKPAKEKKPKKLLSADDADCDDAYKELAKVSSELSESEARNEELEKENAKLKNGAEAKPRKASTPKVYPNKVKKFVSKISGSANNLFSNVIEAVKNQSKPKKDGEIDEKARPNPAKALALIESAKVSYNDVEIPFVELVGLLSKALSSLKIGFSEKNLVDVEMFTAKFESLKRELENAANEAEEKAKEKKTEK